MEDRAHALYAGLFTLLLSVAVAASYWWLSGSNTDRRVYYVLSTQPISGLNAQAVVKFRGVNVGQVAGIELDPGNPTNILIKVAVDKTLRLTRGSYAQLKMQGLTGLAYIELDDTGKNTKILAENEAEQARLPLKASDMDNFIESSKQLVERSKLLIESSLRLVEGGNKLLDARNLEHIEHVLDNLDQSTRKLSPLLANLSQTSQRVNGMFSDERQQRVMAVADSANAVLQQMGPLMQDMRRAAADFHALSVQLQRSANEISGNITDQTLPQFNQLAQQLERDAKRMDVLMQELEQNPQSLVFGKPQSAPGPGEPGFNAQANEQSHKQ